MPTMDGCACDCDGPVTVTALLTSLQSPAGMCDGLASSSSDSSTVTSANSSPDSWNSGRDLRPYRFPPLTYLGCASGEQSGQGDKSEGRITGEAAPGQVGAQPLV